MNHKRTGRLAVVVASAIAALVALVAVAGCGGGEEAEAALTKAQYREKANLICNKVSIEQFGLGSKYLKSHPGAEEVDAVKPAVIPPLEKELQQLQDLPAPSDYEAQIQGFLEALEGAVEAGKENPQSVLAKQNNPFAKANSLGKRYQLGDCSVNP